MKAIVKLSVPWIAWAVTLGAGTTWAAAHPAADGVGRVPLLVGQSSSRSDAARRQDAEKWLIQARQAMKSGNLELAAYYVERAEKLNVQYDAVFARFADTPEKVRRDLEQLKAARAAALPTSGAVAASGPTQPGVVSPPPSNPASAKPEASEPARVDRLPPTREEASGHSVATPAGRASAQIADAAARPADSKGKAEAMRLTAMARAALDRGDLPGAQRLAEQAQSLRVPDSEFAAGETRPWEVLLEIQSAANRRRSEVLPAISGGPAAGDGAPGVTQGLYLPDRDTTRNVLAEAPAATPPASEGWRLYQEGVKALGSQDRAAALQLFRQAWQFQNELDPATRQELKDKLSLLSAAERPEAAGRPPALDEVSAQQEVLRQKMFREIAAEQKTAEQMMASDPRGAVARMQKLRDRVGQTEMDAASRKQLLTLVDRSLQQMQAYVQQHEKEIQLDERNRATLDRIERDQKQKLEVQEKVAELIDRFNTLLEEERFAEAEVVANQVRELDPDSPVTRTLTLKSRFARRNEEQNWLRDKSEQGVYDALTSVQDASVPRDDRVPIDFGDVRKWNDLSNLRRRWFESQRRQLTPAEREIQQSLGKEVEVRFTDRPLKEVLETLGSMAGINIYPDPQGLAAEGVTSDTPVTINLTKPISLRSALDLILQPLRLSHVIQNEVLLITSEQTRDSKVYPKVYNVADLVIPIPNFVPGYNVGLPAAIREAHTALGYGGVIQPVAMQPLTVAANELNRPASLGASVLAQTNAYGLMPKSASRPTQPPGYAMGNLGGAAMADFDTLINLITATVAPDTWDSVGGPGAIQEFPTNLSLVISQTNDVHDQIADLLEQLRRLQDLQVTIEVRFITLRDDWFERIGIDFDFDINDRVTQLPVDHYGPSAVIGLNQDGLPTQNWDISFTQGNFSKAIPAFGSFDASTAASFGFAILSDIDVFFLLNAAEGDVRSNVLQAPKVTMFNGQLASVADQSQRPFVTGLIPVVGDFAAAHQPVVVVLSEGTSLSVQAVVSSDRRFVRMTLVPFFSQIGEVNTFTFQGKTSSDTGTNVIDPDGKPSGDVDNIQTTTEGTTVQLPTFAYTTVSTTVSVPDGGTVLLGGIKRLREGRNESGVPMLSKLPYVNRLFKNVGIGRETQSLMLMVTPRIIIQEEEESKLGIEMTP